MVTLQNNLTFLCLYCAELCRQKKGKIAWHNESVNCLLIGAAYLNIFLELQSLQELFLVFMGFLYVQN